MAGNVRELEGTDRPLHVLRRTGGSNDLSFDEVFAILATGRRRLALHHLSRTDSASSLSELAAQVAAWERERDGSVADGHGRRVERDLRDRHLPRLAEAEVVSFDERSGEVRYHGHPVVEEYAEHVAPDDLPG